MAIYVKQAAINYVAGKARLTQGQATAAVEAMQNMIVEACKRGDELHLDCGKFEKIQKDGVNGIVFRQTQDVKEYLNEPANSGK
ncbi:hypothetical protein [Neptunomonas antarctica]|uniref:DNA-binding protein n=1 Tax=Neptunomonas antarctica TaxID=619304 RepID=A0A1N7MQ36_9GAMM|nr:hypothetical protein [Neptunomonas antarctica]SIS88265.1 hypothetical protein SAMN05421760_106263 [Neptunomonas antarctica]